MSSKKKVFVLDDVQRRVYTRAVMPKRRGSKQRQRLKSSKLSLMVLHRIEDTMELVSSIESYRPRLESVFEKRYAPLLDEGEAPPDQGLALELLAREVKAKLARLMDLDDKVCFGTIEHEALRRKRKRLIDDVLYPLAVAVRGSIELAFGRDAGRLLHGMESRTEHQAEALENQLRRTLLGLKARFCDLAIPETSLAPFDSVGWIRKLESSCRDLTQLNREFRRSESALANLLTQKHEAMEAFDATYGDALSYLRAVFKMVGLDARALKNIKPYYQRRRLSKRARQARESRAAAEKTDGESPFKKPRSTTQEVARVAVPKVVARWLEQTRLFAAERKRKHKAS